MTNAAVQYALAQVGKQYQWGATGPNAFDCSGLVMMAEQHIGVSLPHNSGEQARYLRAVNATWANKQRLHPGDVVFYYGGVSNYDSISHCGVYIGKVGNVWMVVAAVDEQYGVIEHRMNWALKPSAFGFVNHI